MRRCIIVMMWVMMSVTLLAAQAACTGVSDRDYVAVRDWIVAAQTEVDAHHRTEMAATSLGAMVADADRHEDAMDTIYLRLRDELSEIGMCGGVRDQMTDLVNAAAWAPAAHRQAVAGAATLSDAGAECVRYADAMTARHHQMLLAWAGVMECH